MVRALGSKKSELGCGDCWFRACGGGGRGGRPEGRWGQTGDATCFGERVGEMWELHGDQHKVIPYEGREDAYPAFEILYFQTNFKPRPTLLQLVLYVGRKDGGGVPVPKLISVSEGYHGPERTLVESCRAGSAVRRRGRSVRRIGPRHGARLWSRDEGTWLSIGTIGRRGFPTWRRGRSSSSRPGDEWNGAPREIHRRPFRPFRRPRWPERDEKELG